MSKKSTLLDRLRQKYADHVPSSKGQGNVNAMKATRAIELGWLNFDTSVGVYKQVRFRTGGGTRSLSVDKATPSTELLNLATSLFFPGGKSRLGRIEDFDCDLCDFKATVVNDSTVSEQYAEHKAKILRFYLRTKRKLCINMESSEEEIDLPIMSNPRKRKKYDYDRTVQKRRKPSATASDASSVHENRKSSSATRDVKESQNPSVTVPTIQESRNLSTAANGEQGSQNPSATVPTVQGSQNPSATVPTVQGSQNPSATVPTVQGSQNPSATVPTVQGSQNPSATVPTVQGSQNPSATVPTVQGSQNPSATVPTVQGSQNPSATVPTVQESRDTSIDIRTELDSRDACLTSGVFDVEALGTRPITLDAREVQEIFPTCSDFGFSPFTNDVVTPSLYENADSDEPHTSFMISENAFPTYYRDSDVSFGEQPDTLFNPVLNESEKYSEITLSIRRGDCLQGIMSYFSNPDIMNCKISIERILENGKKEAGQGSGVILDCLVEFWSEFFERCTTGVTHKVPYLRHDFRANEWKACARVFLFGFINWKYIPVSLSSIFLKSVLGMSCEQNLVEHFLHYIGRSEKDTLEQAMKEYSSVDNDDLMDVLDSHNCKKLPTACTITELVKEIAHKELVQEPMFVIDCWREVFSESKAQIPEKELDDIYAECIPTGKKVSQRLSVNPTNKNQEETVKHLRRYLKDADENDIKIISTICNR